MVRLFGNLILIFLSLHVVIGVQHNLNPTVTTSLGKIRGEYVTTYTNVSFYRFRSIPYAEPPVGELRFAVGYEYS